MESEVREDKSEFRGTRREWLRLVKTIMAFANTSGGQLYLKGVHIPATEFDSARLTRRVESHIGPRIADITSELDVKEDSSSYDVVINVPDSKLKPHVITREGQYEDDKGRRHWEYYKGQVWVRHSASNAEAGPDDFERMFRQRASSLLSSLGAIVLNTPTEIIDKARESGLGVTVTEDGSGIPVRHVLLPYTATSLAKELGVKRNWVSDQATNRGWRKGMRDYDRRYMQMIPRSNGIEVLQWLYSDLARDELAKQILTQQP